MKFKNLVKEYKSSCPKCLSFFYQLPCGIDEDIIKHLSCFGKPKFDLNKTKFLKIISGDNYIIEGRKDRLTIKISIPKHLGSKNNRKLEFEQAIAGWLSVKIGSTVSV